MAKLTDEIRKRLTEANFWHLATVNEDGSPQVSAVWAHVDGDRVLVNTAIGRRKERNARRDARVALSVTDKDDSYQTIEIRGRVVEFVEGQQAEDSIDELCRKYTGQSPYPWRAPGERRVILLIEPEIVQARF